MKYTWLGDGDPSSQIIYMGELRFIKGEPTEVPPEHGYADMISTNPLFKAELEDERDIVIAELKARDIKFDGRAKLEILRDLLRQ